MKGFAKLTEHVDSQLTEFKGKKKIQSDSCDTPYYCSINFPVVEWKLEQSFRSLFLYMNTLETKLIKCIILQ